MGGGYFRAHQRFAVDVSAALRATRRIALARGRLRDLGIGGAACELDAPLRVGEEVELTLAGPEPLLLVSHVAWIAWAERSTVRMGLRFGPADEDAISQLLHSLGVHADVASE